MSQGSIALSLVVALALNALFVPASGIAARGDESGQKDPSGLSRPCALHPGHSPAPGRSGGAGIALWHPDRILDAGAPLNALAAGDFVRDRPGNETLAGDSSGRLWLAWRENCTWRSKGAWSAGGNLGSLAAGELDGAMAGLEVACGVSRSNGSGAVFVVSGLGGQAAARQVLSSAAAVRAVAAGDVLTGVPGEEVVAVDDGGNVSVAFPNSPARSPQNIIRLAGASRLVVADLDASRAGDEVAVGTSSGEVVELYWEDSAWQERGLWVSPKGVACLAFGESDPLHDGPELAMASASGELTLLERLGDTWSGRSVWSSGASVQALAIGDADSDAAGNELLAGLPDDVTRIRWDGMAWDRERIWEGSGAFGQIAVAEVDADHAGNEVLAAGQNGALTALGLYHPGFSMSAGPSRLTLTGGESASFELSLAPIDKLEGNLTVTVGALPAGISVASRPGPWALALPNISAALNLSVNASVANGEYRFLVTASHQIGIFDSAWLTLVLDRRLDMRVSLSPPGREVRPGSTATCTVTVSNCGTVNDSYRLQAHVEGGWAVRFPAGNLSGKMAPGGNRSLEIEVTVPGDAGGKTAYLTVDAFSLSASNLTRSASIKVSVPQKGGPCSLFLLPAGLVGTAFMLGRKGNKREEK